MAELLIQETFDDTCIVALPPNLAPQIAGLVDLDTATLLTAWLNLIGEEMCSTRGPMGNDGGRVRRRDIISQEWFVTNKADDMRGQVDVVHQCDQCRGGVLRAAAHLRDNPDVWLALAFLRYDQWVIVETTQRTSGNGGEREEGDATGREGG